MLSDTRLPHRAWAASLDIGMACRFYHTFECTDITPKHFSIGVGNSSGLGGPVRYWRDTPMAPCSALMLRLLS